MSTTIIEVNGVKLEVDLRHARRIDELRIGDRVKILRTDSYDKVSKVYPGSIIGFEPFQKLPTIIVAYIDRDWSSVGIKFVHFNAQTTGVELIKSVDDDALDIDKEEVLQCFAREIEKHNAAVRELSEKRAYFVANFKSYWTVVEQKVE